MHKYAPTIVAFVGFVLLIFGIICSAFIFPKLAENAVRENIALKDGTKAYEMWKKQPFPLKFKIYFFHVLNPADVQNGANPIVKEMGPYVYDEFREKVDIRVNEEKDTINYVLKKRYVFNQKDSGCRSEDDEVTIINAAIVGTALQVESIMPTALPMISDAIPYLFPNARDVFLRATVKDILFDGTPMYCHDEEVSFVCNALGGRLPQTIRKHPNGKDYLVSMFNHLNGTDDGPYEIERGLKDTVRGKIASFKGETKLDVWNGEFCNMINGTDSTVFSPITDSNKKNRLYVFATDFCRSLYSSYDKDTTTFEIRTVRYATTGDALAINEENRCFCLKEEDENGETLFKCTPSGTVDISPCVKVPLLISFPHFYLGENSLLQYVTGVNPHKELHETFAELEPLTGTPVIGKKRIQMNIHLKPIPAFELMANVSDGIFPIIWLEEGAELPEAMITMLKSELEKLNLLEYLKWCLIGSGILLMFSSFVMILYKENLLCFDNSTKISDGSVKGNPVVSTETIIDNSIMMYPSLYPQTNNRNVHDSVIRRP